MQFHNHTEITEALQRLLRTAMFAVRFRGPDLIKFIVEDGWQLCGEGIRAYVMDFSRLGRVGTWDQKIRALEIAVLSELFLFSVPFNCRAVTLLYLLFCFPTLSTTIMFLWVGSLFSQVKHWKISWLAYMQSQPAMTLSRQCFPTTRRRHSIPSYSCEVSGPLWLRMLSLFFMLSRLVPASIVFLFSQKQVVVMTTTLTLSFLWCRIWTDWEYLQTIERICGQREQ